MKSLGEAMEKLELMGTIPQITKEYSEEVNPTAPIVKIVDSEKLCQYCGAVYRKEMLIESGREYVINEYTSCDCSKLLIAGIARMKFENFNKEREPEAYQTALEYAENPKGWILFAGINGSGKSHLAAAIVHRLKSKYKFLFTSCKNILDYVKNNDWDNSKFKLIDLLVMDELGFSMEGDWAIGTIYDIISFREKMEMLTVFTTNFNSIELHQKIGSASLDRVLGLSKIVKMKSEKSYRLENAGF